MIRFLLRRLVSALVTLWITTSVTFFAVSFAPGDFLTEARLNPQVAPEATRALEIRYGLNEPPLGRYWNWLRGAAVGDWGESYNSGQPVLKLLAEPAERTIWLVGLSVIAVWAFCLGGCWLGWFYASRWLWRGSETIAASVISVPAIVLVLGVAWLFARLGLDLNSGVAAGAALFLSLAPSLFLQSKAAVDEAGRQPFVQAARDRRLGEFIVFWRYVLPAAAPALAGLVGLSIGSGLSSSLLVECTLGRPGLGTVLLEAVLARDAAVVTAGVTFSTMIWIAGNLIADLLQYAADPRLRTIE